jgi:hypothetical protein
VRQFNSPNHFSGTTASPILSDWGCSFAMYALILQKEGDIYFSGLFLEPGFLLSVIGFSSSTDSALEAAGTLGCLCRRQRPLPLFLFVLASVPHSMGWCAMRILLGHMVDSQLSRPEMAMWAPCAVGQEAACGPHVIYIGHLYLHIQKHFLLSYTIRHLSQQPRGVIPEGSHWYWPCFANFQDYKKQARLPPVTHVLYYLLAPDSQCAGS